MGEGRHIKGRWRERCDGHQALLLMDHKGDGCEACCDWEKVSTSGEVERAMPDTQNKVGEIEDEGCGTQE